MHMPAIKWQHPKCWSQLTKMRLLIAFIALSMGSCVLSIYIKSHIDVDSFAASRIPKCNEDDYVCVAQTFTRFFQCGDECTMESMPDLKPLKPPKPLDTMTMQSRSKTGLGITFDGRASNIAVYGLDQLEFHAIELRTEMCKYKRQMDWIRTDVDLLFGCVHSKHAHIGRIDFIMNLTARSVLLGVSMETCTVPRNDKHHLKIHNVKAKLLDLDASFDLQSKSLSPFLVRLINHVLNYSIELFDDFENYVACLIESIAQSILDEVAMQDMFH